MEPVLLTFAVLFGSTYGISEIYLRDGEKLHKTAIKRRIHR